MYKPPYVLGNGFLKLSRILRHKQITSASIANLVTITKRKKILPFGLFCCLVDHRMKIKESEKKELYFDLASELRKLGNMMVTVIPLVIGALGTVPKGLEKGSGRVGNQGENEDHPDQSFIEICKNTEKSPDETCCHQTPVKDHIQTDHLISARRSDLKILNKNKNKREPAKLWTLLSQLTTEQN